MAWTDITDPSYWDDTRYHSLGSFWDGEKYYIPYYDSTPYIFDPKDFEPIPGYMLKVTFDIRAMHGGEVVTLTTDLTPECLTSACEIYQVVGTGFVLECVCDPELTYFVFATHDAEITITKIEIGSGISLFWKNNFNETEWL